ncbi:hypothetical protein GII33_16520 [Gordonia pseudamarae]|jgi:hypothetical protein|uniref:Uncharacterized protein n=1 Tax=Gordonia pseudamarae TaxID=2831662 RepID=A0ABX6IJW6_9ACTN|nr:MULTISPECIES: hypothetical protein [Gordonia]MBD0022702.1 hypothetical protein [Gordonia sp. (in: high G+C Gram-positive bacteria)]QHN27314.1 hypothetical protein GII33_16520 [Gordonia pseudamarae]QHN36198.1 hypothetical protein GII31_16295 [Gordonia pseudamarae]
MNNRVDDQLVAGAAPCAADVHPAASSPFGYPAVTDRVSGVGHPAPGAGAEHAHATARATAVQAQHVDGLHCSWRGCELSGKAKPAPAAIASVGALRIAEAGIDAIARARQRFPVFLPKSLK